MRLSDRLKKARNQSFAGREKEIELFKQLAFSPSNYFLLFLHGPGGQGKTVLLRKFRDICSQRKLTYLLMDGREQEAHPNSLLTALREVLGLSTGEDPFEALERRQDRFILFFDTFEKFGPIEIWLREEFFPQMPENVFVVLSGRTPPEIAWRTDSGWKEVMKILPLETFGEEDCQSYLNKRNLPAEVHQEIIRFTHGHPLALSVVADLYQQQPEQQLQPEDSPDLIRALLEQFLEQVPSYAHKSALEICALVHLTTESLLAEVLGPEKGAELFDWLRGLSFIEAGKMGLYPHELAREALTVDLKWRNPDSYAELHEKSRKYYLKKLESVSGEAQRIWLFELIYLHRANPVIRPFFTWEEGSSYWMDHMREEDIPTLRKMVARHEGEASAQQFEQWVDHPCSEVWVWREAKEAVAFLMNIQAETLVHQPPDHDPAVRQLLSHANQYFHLREGEQLVLFRYWMAEDTHQAVSDLQSSIFLAVVQYYFRPGLAISMLCLIQPEFWAQGLNYADLHHVQEIDFLVNEVPFGWYYHDWRKRPPLAWLDLLGQREVGGKVEEQDPLTTPKLAVVLLSEAEFEEAVHQALKHYGSNKELSNNLLIRSRFVIKHTGEEADEEARMGQLQQLIDEAMVEINQSSTLGKYHRVLYRTFINPVGSQERTADFLNMSFSTYRRYLKAGVSEVAKILWEQEVG
ncbi:MAG: ATP-binding protein [Bacteroidota bacterium]